MDIQVRIQSMMRWVRYAKNMVVTLSLEMRGILEEEQLPDQLKAICPWLKECEFGCTNYLFEKDGRYGIALELEWDPDECRRDDFIKIGETKTAIAINLIVIMGYPVIVELIPPEDSIIGYILRIFIPTDKMKYEDYQKIGKKVEEILDALW